MLELYEKVRSYFLTAGGQLNIFGKLIKIGLIFLVLRIAISTINRFLQSSLKNKRKAANSLDHRRLETLAGTLNKVIKALMYFFFALMVLEMFDIDTKSILATAGIGGVAIGFGAQSLVKDVINGFFILQDNLYVVGDHISIQGNEGLVEELGLRTTKIRDFSGDLHIIPNGEIKVITNKSRGAQRALVIVSIAYEEDIDRANRVLAKVCQAINLDYQEDLVEPIEVVGVEGLAGSSVDIRLAGMVQPGEHWKLERAIRKAAKEALAREDIEIPYQKMVVYQEANQA